MQKETFVHSDKKKIPVSAMEGIILRSTVKEAERRFAIAHRVGYTTGGSPR